MQHVNERESSAEMDVRQLARYAKACREEREITAKRGLGEV